MRIHEQAHASVGGQYAGAPSYEYQRGPDGTNYAVGGEVQIDVAQIEGDPKATIEKCKLYEQQLAPQEPSGADRAIAADATQKLAAAQAELATQSDDDKQQNGQASFRINREFANDDSSQVSASETKTAKRDVEVDQRAQQLLISIKRQPLLRLKTNFLRLFNLTFSYTLLTINRVVPIFRL